MLSTKKFTLDPKNKQVESERMAKIFHANSNQEHRVAILIISGKIDFKSKKVTRDKEGKYILTKYQYCKNNNYTHLCI